MQMWALLQGEYLLNYTGTIDYLKFYFESASIDYNFYIDDVQIMGPVLIGDKFEGETAENWSATWSACDVTTTDTNKFAGTKSMLISNRDANSDGAKTTITNVVANQTYYASAWVYMPDINSTTKVVMTAHGGGLSYNWVANKDLAVGSSWVNLSGSFTPTESSDITFYFETNGDSAPFENIYIDNIYISGPTELIAPSPSPSPSESTSPSPSPTPSESPSPSASPSPTASSVPGFLDNYDFEADTTGWTGNNATIEQSAEQARNGSNSLKVSGRTADWNNAQTDLTEKVLNGQTYYISGWVYIPEGATPGSTKISAVLNVDGDSTYANIATVTPVAGEWTLLSGEYLLDYTGTLGYLKFYFESSSIDYDFYIDDIQITGHKLLGDTFEGATAENWESTWSSCDVALTSDQKLAGSKSLSISNRDANSDGAQTTITNVMANQTYYASAWVYMPDITETTKIVMTANGGGLSYSWVANKDISAGSSWVNISGSFTPTESSDILLYFETNGATTFENIYIDNIYIAGTIETIPPTPEPPQTHTAAIYNSYDFESDTTGWSPRGSALLEISDTQAHSGDYSMKISGRTATWNGATTSSLSSKVQNNQKYYYSAWIYIDSDTPAQTKLSAEITDGAGTSYPAVASKTPVGKEWVFYDGVFTCSYSDVLSSLKFYIESNDISYDIYVDDIQIMGPVLVGETFDTGTTSGWTGRGPATATLSTDYSLTGNYSLAVSGRTANWHGTQLDLTGLQ